MKQQDITRDNLILYNVNKEGMTYCPQPLGKLLVNAEQIKRNIIKQEGQYLNHNSYKGMV